MLKSTDLNSTLNSNMFVSQNTFVQLKRNVTGCIISFIRIVISFVAAWLARVLLWLQAHTVFRK